MKSKFLPYGENFFKKTYFHINESWTNYIGTKYFLNEIWSQMNLFIFSACFYKFVECLPIHNNTPQICGEMKSTWSHSPSYLILYTKNSFVKSKLCKANKFKILITDQPHSSGLAAIHLMHLKIQLNSYTLWKNIKLYLCTYLIDY